MPAEFTKQLKRPTRERLADTSLHHAVFDLVCSYHLNYNMIFPAPNASTTFVQFVKTLALPGIYLGLVCFNQIFFFSNFW